MIVIVLCPIIVTICGNTMQGAITWTKTRHSHLSVEDPVKHSLLKLPNWLTCTEILGLQSGMTFFFCIFWQAWPAWHFWNNGYSELVEFLQLVTLRCFSLQILTFHLGTLRTGVFIPTCASWIASWHFHVPFHFKAMDKNPGPNETSPLFFGSPNHGCKKRMKNAQPAAGSKLPQSLEFWWPLHNVRQLVVWLLKISCWRQGEHVGSAHFSAILLHCPLACWKPLQDVFSAIGGCCVSAGFGSFVAKFSRAIHLL